MRSPFAVMNGNGAVLDFCGPSPEWRWIYRFDRHLSEAYSATCRATYSAAWLAKCSQHALSSSTPRASDEQPAVDHFVGHRACSHSSVGYRDLSGIRSFSGDQSESQFTQQANASQLISLCRARYRLCLVGSDSSAVCLSAVLGVAFQDDLHSVRLRRIPVEAPRSQTLVDLANRRTQNFVKPLRNILSLNRNDLKSVKRITE